MTFTNYDMRLTTNDLDIDYPCDFGVHDNGNIMCMHIAYSYAHSLPPSFPSPTPPPSYFTKHTLTYPPPPHTPPPPTHTPLCTPRSFNDYNLSIITNIKDILERGIKRTTNDVVMYRGI